MLTRTQRAQKPARGKLAPQDVNSPSKEYIYAGGKLIATEEPAAAPPVPTGVVAIPSGTATTISVRWSASPGAVSYTVQRRTTVNDPNPMTLPTTTTNSLTDNVPTGGMTYLYYVSANGPGGISSAYSTLTPTSFATAISFFSFTGSSAPPLAAGSVIYAVHINTIRNAIDAVRHAAGLQPFSYNYSILTGSTILANDIVDVGVPSNLIPSMRTALTQAYTSQPPPIGVGFGFSTPSFTNAISTGSQVNFADFSDFSGYSGSQTDGLVRGYHP
jgi:hypothetical protein